MEYIKKNKNGDVKFTFIKSNELPDLPITTPLTFAFIGYDLLLAKKKSGDWDILGGKVEKDEFWIDALKREALEEAGVYIDNIDILGYVLAEHDNPDISFPKKSILPVTISFVKEVLYDWKKYETLDRRLFRKKHALKEFETKNDNKQIYRIFNEIVYPYLTGEYSVEFGLADSIKDLTTYPVTQTMSFISVNDKFLVVRDYDEKEFSLVGGGCELDENIFSSAKREILEEAQLRVDELEFVSSTVVKLYNNNKHVVSKLQQIKFVGKKNDYDINSFVPRKNGFETEEVKLVQMEELLKTKILNNQNGRAIVESLNKKINENK